MNYGSENEETNFIRRVADPDRPNSKRRQKKRLALAGAATLLIGVSAAVGYVTLQSTQSVTVEAPVKQQLAANLVVPDFVDSLGDPYYPSFDDLDEDGDGIVSYDEYMKDLHEVWDQDRVDIANSDLPDVVKEDLNSQLDAKVVSDSACVKKAMIPTKKRKLTFDRTTVDSLYYMLEVYCFDTPISVPEKYMKMFPDTQAPAPPPAPVVPAIPAPPVVTDAPTSAPIDISTPGGDKTVTLVGPPEDGKQKVKVDTGGVVVTTTVKVEETDSGGEKLNITIPGGGTTTVTVPANNIPNSSGGSKSSGTTTTGTQTNPSPGGSNNGFPSVQTTTTTGLQSVDIDTTYGRWTVVLNGPGKWEGTADLTILKHDGSAPEKQSVDISSMADGSQFVHIFTGDENKKVVFPPLTKTTSATTTPTTSSRSGGGSYNGFPSVQTTTTTGLQSVDIDTTYGRWTVVLNGPGKWEGTADLTILKHDGSAPEKQSVDISSMADGSQFVHIFTGDENKKVVFPPLTKTTSATTTPTTSSRSGGGSYNGFPSVQTTTTTGLQSVDIDTTYGRWTVVLNGPGKWEGTADLTILKHDGSAPEKQSVDISSMADGSQFVHIFTGDENKKVVFPPLTKTTSATTTPTTSSRSGGGSYNGFPSVQTTTTTGLQSVDIDTTYGRWTVVLNGPGKWEGTADLTILKHDGSAPEKQSVDISSMADGSQFVHIFTGDENKKVVFPPLTKTTSATTTPTTSSRSGGGSYNGFPSVPSNPTTRGSSSGFPSTPQQLTLNGHPAVAFETSSGRWTVELNGASMKGTEFVQITIYKSDGSVDKQDVPVTMLADGSQLVYVWADNEKHKVVFAPSSNNGMPFYTTPGSSGNGIPPTYPVTGGSGNGISPEPSNPSSTGSNGGFPSVPSNPSGGGAKGLTSVDIDTPSGQWTVILNGAGKWDGTVNITVEKHDGSAPETYEVDGSPKSDDPWYAWVYTGDRTKRVVFPQSSNNDGSSSGGSSSRFPSVPSISGSSSGFPSMTSDGGKPTVDVDTSFGRWTVVFDGLGPIMGTGDITILKHDGSPPERQTVDISSQRMDGTISLNLWTGAETKEVVFPPQKPTPTKRAAEPTSDGVYQFYTTDGKPSVDINTSSGRWTLIFEGPERSDHTVEFTILKHDGSDPVPRGAEVVPGSDGSNFINIWTGDETKKVPLPPASAWTSGPSKVVSGSSSGISSVQQTTTGLRSLDIDTSYGRWTVVLNGPGKWEGTADLTIFKHDGSAPEKQEVDWTPNADGSTYVYLWTGAESKDLLFPPLNSTNGGTTAPSSPSGGGSNNGFSSVSSNRGSNSGFPSTPQQFTLNGHPAVAFETSSGRWTVELNGASMKGTDFVKITIYSSDGSIEEQDTPVTVLADGAQLVYVMADGEKHKVVFPPGSNNGGGGSYSPSTAGSGSGRPSSPTNPSGGGANGKRSVDIDTPSGRWTVVLDGPGDVTGTADITILKQDGSPPEKQTVDISNPMADGSMYIYLWTGDKNKKVTFPPPSQPVISAASKSEAGSNDGVGKLSTTAGKPSIDIDTPTGKWTVIFEGPEKPDATVDLTILKHDGSDPESRREDVVPDSDGMKFVYIWTVGDKKKIPLPPASVWKDMSSNQASSSSTHGWSSSSGAGGGSSSPVETSVEVAIPGGVMVVQFHGPPTGDNKQNVTVTSPEGILKVVLDVSLTGNGAKWVNIPLQSGNKAVQIPGYGGTDTGTQSQVVNIETPKGNVTVETDGPIINGQQNVNITKPDGTSTIVTVDVVKTNDGKTALQLPSGDEGQTTLVTLPPTDTPSAADVLEKPRTVVLETSEGIVKVLFYGLITNGKQSVTVLKFFDNSLPQQMILDVFESTVGKNTVKIPTGPGTEVQYVAVPPFDGPVQNIPNTNVEPAPTLPEVVIDTPQGPTKVIIDGPVIDNKQDVTIVSSNGDITTTTVDVVQNADGKNDLVIPGPDGKTTTVTVSTSSTGSGSTGGSQQQTVSVDTKKGEETVTLDGPVVNGKQNVIITTPKGVKIKKTVDVIRTSDGKNAIEVPTGPEGQSTIITIPQSGSSSSSTAGSQTSSQAAAPATVVDTPHGSATVTANGPVIGGKQIVTITTDDGKTITTLVDATTTKDGNTKVDLPMGRGGTTTAVTVQTTSTTGSGQTNGDNVQTTGGGGQTTGGGGGQSTTDILNQTGINDVDNGDKDFMSKDEFQLQIGAHFSQKIKGLKNQTKDEKAAKETLLDQEKKLQDCILLASNKFGYYGVYEQAPYFQDAVDWVDNDCLKQ
ncbi:hypothetical protein P3T76_009311 [Phytophthora citrophthora]|uniref:EF-hand domain-containing protein n=1 Tax=Phytophthora citrophthora TaxID=4793 RepID=A0AAD9GHA8_9STRA|nr:hypothetical protein P3T76_009311 [Phytophthora citrophthora]